MPTQKTFKGRVRVRMTKTGESYTAARRQLLDKSADRDAAGVDAAIATTVGAETSPATEAFGVSDDAMQRATGKRHAEWFALLDAWGASAHGHTEIARWLSATHGVPGWWTQSVTVAYERARGMRARHEMRDGFSVSATRTIVVAAEDALAAFTSAPRRRRWLPDAPMRQRPTRAAGTARFDWSDPPSRVVVTVVPKGEGKSLVGVTHEQLPDAASGERLKASWREWLGTLKEVVERG